MGELLKIQKLIELLKEVDFSTFKESEDETGWFGSDEEIEEVLCEIIILPNGGVDYAAIAILKEYGYSVYPGEKDSFGWLTGVLQFPDGEHYIVFG